MQTDIHKDKGRQRPLLLYLDLLAISFGQGSGAFHGSMSLYSDNPGDQEPFQLLTAALSAPAESKDQVDALLVVSGLLEQRPAAVAEICLPLFEAIKSTGDTALKRWVMDRIAFGVGRSSLEVEAKTSSRSHFTHL